MRNHYLFHCAAVFILLFSANCSAQDPYNIRSDQQTLQTKIYLNSEDIYILDGQILCCLNGEVESLSMMGRDDLGIYTYLAYYQPWHDDDWLCPKGHWSPSYEKKCVSCGMFRTIKSPCYGDKKR